MGNRMFKKLLLIFILSIAISMIGILLSLWAITDHLKLSNTIAGCVHIDNTCSCDDFDFGECLRKVQGIED